MAEIVFRACTRNDLEALQRLVQELYKSDPGEYPVEPDIHPTFAELKSHPEKGQIVVFQQGSELVGYAILVFFWSNEFGGDFIEIDELLVASRFQGQGVGKKFFKWLETFEHKCVGYALQVHPENERAIALYKSAGFAPSRSRYWVKI